MKLSQAKPCSCCGGALLKPPIGNWYVIRTSITFVRPGTANGVLGVAQLLGGIHALGVAEAMAPHADSAIAIGMDESRDLMTELHVCLDCWTGPLRALSLLVEAANTTVPA